MPKYKISENVSGVEKVITAKEPVKALIKYLKGEIVNPNRSSWNYDFEIEKMRKMRKRVT